jgi:hypothetical protein
VREVSSGGYILAGYTANYTPNDTDGLVLRLNANGDTLWSLVYDGPNHNDDCFYKVVPLSGGGYYTIAADFQMKCGNDYNRGQEGCQTQMS